MSWVAAEGVVVGLAVVDVVTSAAADVDVVGSAVGAGGEASSLAM